MRSGDRNVAPNLAIDHYLLPNGMELILHVDPKAPIVHLNFRYRVRHRYRRALGGIRGMGVDGVGRGVPQ
jgi:hypothetical protein